MPPTVHIAGRPGWAGLHSRGVSGVAGEQDVMTLLRAAYEAGRKAALFDQTEAGRPRPRVVTGERPITAGRTPADEEWQH